MENNLEITIGIPVYHVEKYIEKSLKSALNQDFKLPYEIIVVDEGRIIERGTHDELIELNGWYKRMFDYQQLENKIEGGVR